jgi:glycosyltransferase involved in cell wall biosynthesis
LLGFDAEDFHRGEFPDDEISLRNTLTENVEARYLPACDHLTAASEGIAKAYAETLDIRKPATVLNVFPLSERSGKTPPEALDEEKLPEGVISLYWYSQVIGPDRGLQDALQALSRLDKRVHLTLRGRWADGFEEEFRKLARNLGVEHRLRVLAPAPPDQLVERAAQHDVGLALEQGHTRNRDVCITNKILAYLLAGLPVVATDTTGQRQICEAVPAATRLCAIGDSESLAEAVRSFVADETSWQQAKAAAESAGEEQYNWELEKTKLLDVVRRTLSRHSANRPAEPNIAE